MEERTEVKYFKGLKEKKIIHLEICVQKIYAARIKAQEMYLQIKEITKRIHC